MKTKANPYRIRSLIGLGGARRNLAKHVYLEIPVAIHLNSAEIRKRCAVDEFAKMLT